MSVTVRPLPATLLAAWFCLLVSSAAGALPRWLGLTGERELLCRALCLLAGGLLLLPVLRKISLSREKRDGLHRFHPALPLLLLTLFPLTGGVAVRSPTGIAVHVLLAGAVGFWEELSFRGVVYALWLRKSPRYALLVSSALFGAFHLLNWASWPDVLLQGGFAFFYGLALALLLRRTGSLSLCVLLHGVHDLFAFLCPPLSGGWIVIQFFILIVYSLLLLRADKDRIV